MPRPLGFGQITGNSVKLAEHTCDWKLSDAFVLKSDKGIKPSDHLAKYLVYNNNFLLFQEKTMSCLFPFDSLHHCHLLGYIYLSRHNTCITIPCHLEFNLSSVTSATCPSWHSLQGACFKISMQGKICMQSVFLVGAFVKCKDFSKTFMWCKELALIFIPTLLEAFSSRGPKGSSQHFVGKAYGGGWFFSQTIFEKIQINLNLLAGHLEASNGFKCDRVNLQTHYCRKKQRQTNQLYSV